jgi:hypothetical protein
VGGLAAAFENSGIAGFDGEGGDVRDDFGTGFEDDEEDADGAGDAVEEEIVVELCAEGDLSDWQISASDV